VANRWFTSKRKCCSLASFIAFLSQKGTGQSIMRMKASSSLRQSRGSSWSTRVSLRKWRRWEAWSGITTLVAWKCSWSSITANSNSSVCQSTQWLSISSTRAVQHCTCLNKFRAWRLRRAVVYLLSLKARNIAILSQIEACFLNSQRSYPIKGFCQEIKDGSFSYSQQFRISR